MKRRILALLIAFTSMLDCDCSRADESIVTSTMIGHWEGSAHIVVAWCHHTELPVKIDIHADGAVTGTIGDAKLTDGHFQQNRGWLKRKLNLSTDYIITGGLDGPIIAADGITRAKVKMPLDFKGSMFVGGVNTSGSGFEGFYGKADEGKWLAAEHLKLARHN